MLSSSTCWVAHIMDQHCMHMCWPYEDICDSSRTSQACYDALLTQIRPPLFYLTHQGFVWDQLKSQLANLESQSSKDRLRLGLLKNLLKFLLA